MYIRKKKNKSESVSIQIIEKRNRKYKVVETIGCARNEIEKELLLNKAKKRLKELQPTLFDFGQVSNFVGLDFIVQSELMSR